MSFDRAAQFAALSFAKPLFQHRAVHVLGADAARAAAFMKEHGAGVVTVVEVSAIAALPAHTIEMLFCALDADDLREDTWAALQRALAENGVVVAQTRGDALRWTQALAKRFASVERAEIVHGEAAWVGPSGAVTATVTVDDAATFGAVFVCAQRPQRLALGSVCLAAGAVEVASARPTVERSLGGDLAESLEEDRLRELEGRLAQTMEDLLQAQLVAAQALAERDSLKRKLELQKGAPTTDDAGVLVALRDELDAIAGLVEQLPRVS